jgi:hypothetical protein
VEARKEIVPALTYSSPCLPRVSRHFPGGEDYSRRHRTVHPWRAQVTGLGLLPLAIGCGDPGREIEGPIATVILGGLVTSTLLNLLVLPTLAVSYGRFEAR